MRYVAPRKVYKNHHIDSTIWDLYKPRDGDIIISTGFKSGTTWMQAIISHMLYDNLPGPFPVVSPWIEYRWGNRYKRIQMLAAQKSRRILKTHLPADALPYYKNVKYVVVSRHFLDVAVSIYHHYSMYTQAAYKIFTGLPKCPDDFHAFYGQWIQQGGFYWESEGYPFWGVMRHLKTWWAMRSAKNIKFVHYNNLLFDASRQLAEIADYLGININGRIDAILNKTNIDSMRRKADMIWGPQMEKIWRGGTRAFFDKKNIAGWMDIITPGEYRQYRRKIKSLLPAACVKWVERGVL